MRDDEISALIEAHARTPDGVCRAALRAVILAGDFNGELGGEVRRCRPVCAGFDPMVATSALRGAGV
jgi:hypothetical protein